MGLFSKKLPIEKESQAYEFGDVSPQYEFKSIAQMYNECPYVRAILDYKASCVSNAKLKLYKKDNNGDIEIFDDSLLSLMNNPNPLQSGNDLLAQTILFESLYSNSFIRGIKGIGKGFKKSTALWSLPPDLVDVVYKNLDYRDMYNQFRLDSIIDYFNFSNSDGITKLYSDEVIYNQDISISLSSENNVVNSKSKFKTLKKSVANLMYIQESRGVIIRNRGALGMLTQAAQNRDAGGSFFLKDEHRTNILKSFKKLYGLRPGQSSVIIPDVPMTWQNMTIPIRDLMLDESALHEFNVCCDIFGVPRGIFDDKTSYNNQLELKKKIYTDTVIPFCNKKASAFNYKFELTDKYFKYDFSHLDCFQEDELKKAQSEKVTTEKLDLMYKSKVISKGVYLQELGYNTTKSDFNTYYENEKGV